MTDTADALAQPEESFKLPTPDRGKGLVKELRPGFINLWEINGLDFENCTITRHPDFANPKTILRQDVLADLASAETPDTIAPIEIYITKGGFIEVLDGDHRVINALTKYREDPDSWGKIKATKFTGTLLQAKIRAITTNLPGSRDNLSESEFIGAVERCNTFGLTPAEIVKMLGRGNERRVNKINLILQAVPEVIEAAKAGTIDLESAKRISTDYDLKDQPAALDRVQKELESTGGNQRAARQKAGIGIQRTKIKKLEEIREMLYPHWENYAAMVRGEINKDEFVMGFCGAILRVLKLTPNYDENQESDADVTGFENIYNAVNPHYEAYLEALREPARPRTRKADKG